MEENNDTKTISRPRQPAMSPCLAPPEALRDFRTNVWGSIAPLRESLGCALTPRSTLRAREGVPMW